MAFFAGVICGIAALCILGWLAFEWSARHPFRRIEEGAWYGRETGSRRYFMSENTFLDRVIRRITRGRRA